jgi:arylsulfatase A-like enzyme
METFIARRFPAEIGRMKIGVVAAAIGLGVIVGLVAELLLRLRHPAPKLARRSASAQLVESALLVAAVHSALVLWAMADTPQLYSARWYAQGGLPRTVQVLATDWLGPRGVVLVALALALAYVRPTRIAYLVRRLLVAVRRPWRGALAALAKSSAVAVIAAATAAAAFGDEATSVKRALAAGEGPAAGGSSRSAPARSAPARSAPARSASGRSDTPRSASSSGAAGSRAAASSSASTSTSSGGTSRAAASAGAHASARASADPGAPAAHVAPGASSPDPAAVEGAPQAAIAAGSAAGSSVTAPSADGSSPAGSSAAGGSPAASSPPIAAVGNGQSPLNILILAADSLRNDRLDPRVAPNLSRLASRGTRFDRAYVSLPRTFPSWVTILTGRHAHHHGVRSMFPTWEERAKDFDALPARFARAGFATSVVSDYAGDIFTRIDLGFTNVETPSFDFRQMIRQKALERETPLLPVLHSQVGRMLFPVMRELSAAADPRLLADDVEAELQAVRNKPFFMTVFFSTAHFPYAAPAPYYRKYTSPRYRGRFKYHKPLGLGSASELPPDPDDIRQIQALYDGAVTGIDDAVGRVLETLDRLGLSERTIIVVTADHGETLFDSGHGQGHGDHLFGDEGTHVPLVIYDPRLGRRVAGARKDIVADGRRVGSVVRDVDLAPTLYDLTGLTPPSDLDGRSLLPALRGEPLEPRFAYAETELWFTEEIPALPPELRMPYPGVVGLTELDLRHNTEIVLKKEMVAPTLMARHRMVRDERYKLLYVPTRTGVRYMLYDTEKDPNETKDVAAELPNEVARLRAELWAWMLKDPLMEQRDGYLVPREGALGRGGAQ